jgi:hypothetical protein
VRQLTIPDCWDSGILVARTGCQVLPSPAPTTNLTCETGNCGGTYGVENCGGINGPKPASIAEFTFDGGIPANCTGADNYDVSFVAGFNVLIETAPCQNGCGSAGSGCTQMPVCPWNTYVFQPDTQPNVGGFVVTPNGDIGTCLSPFNMASIGLPPLENMSADQMNRLGCVGGYDETPWTNNDAWGVCMTNFGNNTDSCAMTSSTTCGTNMNIPPTGNSTPPCCEFPATMCDPYGQCDSVMGRTAAWPTDNDGGSPTEYIENVHEACGDNTSGGQAGAYAWSFDDGDQVLGLANALFTCQGDDINYVVTLCPDSAPQPTPQPTAVPAATEE